MHKYVTTRESGGMLPQQMRLLLWPFWCFPKTRQADRVSNEYLPFMAYNTGFRFLIICLSCKPHLSHMRLARLSVCLEELKVVGRETQKSSFTPFHVSTCYLCSWMPCVHICWAVVLIGNTKQATSEVKSSQVETELTRLAATALWLNNALLFYKNSLEKFFQWLQKKSLS